MVALFEIEGRKCEALGKPRKVETRIQKHLHSPKEGRENPLIILSCSNCIMKLRVRLKVRRERSFVDSVNND